MISYTITACDEHIELDTLLNFLRTTIKKEDEIVLQLDSEKVTDAVRGIALLYKSRIPVMKVVEFPLNGDFSSFKNNLKMNCSNKWIFNIDADEIPSEFLLENIHSILQSNDNVDVIVVPRWNIVSGITDDHIQKWRWKFDNEGRINWPDWQMRIYKNNENIRWKNKVHEVLEGFENYSMLPEEKDYCLFHKKSIDRQEKQNNFYDNMVK
jgi:hypothetical protein